MKHTLFKKSTAFLLAMSMVFSLFMVTASAEDKAKDKVRVLIRIEAPDKTVVYPETISVDNFSLKEYGATEEKTAPTALHALIQALGMDESGPDNNFSVDTTTGWINQIGDYKTTNYYSWMYAINDDIASVGCSNYQIKDGDELVFYYMDFTIGGYSFFRDSDVTAKTGEKVNFMLDSVYYENNVKQTGLVEKADILVSKVGEEDATINTGVKTDVLGHAQLTFDKPGTYIVSALRYGNKDNNDTSDISRPRCKVVVTGDAVSSTTNPSTPAKPVITTSEGGSAVLNADGKTVNITANDGYKVADVTVNGKSVGAVSQYVLSDSEKTAAINVKFSKTTVSEPTNSSTSVNGFSDVANHWAKSAISYVTEEGLFSGTTDTTFSPNVAMTRGMFVTVLGRYAKAKANATTDFTDVNEDEYYAPYVAWANENGIVSGTSASTFSPNTPITREQAMMMLYQYAQFKGEDVSNIEGMAIREFSDANKISSWANTAVRYGFNANIISGRTDGTLDPQGTATRAEIAAMMQKFIEHLK